jgi:hypothetical protein
MASFPIAGDAVLSADGKTFLLTTGAPRLAQRMRVGIRTILGTYKYDLSKGVPWFRLLDKPNQALIRPGIRDFFLSFPEVHSIIDLQFTVDRQTRLMTVTYQLRMGDGQVVTATSPITPLA